MVLSMTASYAQTDFKLEYYLNEDPGYGKGKVISIKVTEDTPITFTIPTTGLTPGTHSLGFRIQNAKGLWSHNSRHLIEIIKEQEQVIIALEYFFGNEPDIRKGTPVAITPNFEDGEFTFRIPKTELTEGQKTLFLRGFSKRGDVSHTQWKSANIRFLNCTVPTITQNGGILSASVADAYQWLRDGNNITGATLQAYTPIENGAYRVRTVTKEGCEEISEPFMFVVTGLEPGFVSQTSVYPNPFSEQLNVVFSSSKPATVSIYGVNGKLLHLFTNLKTQFSTTTRQWPAGSYLIRVEQGGSIVTQKVIVKN